MLQDLIGLTVCEAAALLEAQAVRYVVQLYEAPRCGVRDPDSNRVIRAVLQSDGSALLTVCHFRTKVPEDAVIGNPDTERKTQ